LGSMKSYGYHMSMQQLLPFYLWGLMVVELQIAMIRFSHVFRWVCVQVWNLSDIASMWENVAITLSLLEKQFPLTFSK
jgi:hypothetical protein